MRIWELDFTEGKQYKDNNSNEIWYGEEETLVNEDGNAIEYVFELIQLLKLDFEELIDWSKIPVDTKVLVRDYDINKWSKRYFAKYENGKVYCYNSGKTSFSKSSENDISSWDCVKLYKEDKPIEDE